MNPERSIALEQIVAEIEALSLADQIWLVERLTDRILIQLDQPQMVTTTPIVPLAKPQKNESGSSSR
jgi:hypothetical protein